MRRIPPHGSVAILAALVLAPALLGQSAPAGCASPGAGSAAPDGYEPAGPISLRISPASASAGVPRTIEIWGEGTQFSQEPLRVDFGDGVQVPVVLVDSDFHLGAQILVDGGAALGRRDVTVSWAGLSHTLRDAFTVESGSIDVSPPRAALGDTVAIEVTGWGTQFVPGYTVLSVADVVVHEFSVQSPSRIAATIHVPPRSTPGARDLVVYNPGGDAWTLDGGFVVDRISHAMKIIPPEADQGQTLEVRVQADGAHWSEGQVDLDLGTGVVTEDVAVDAPDRLTARIRVGNNALTGPRDVVVRDFVPGTDAPLRLILDGFTVWPVEANPLRARVSLSFGISRFFDPESCAWDPAVYAGALFYETNDFPCPPSGSSSTLMAPPHFDMVGSGFTVQGGATDCPATKTFDAGPSVLFVAEHGNQTIPLERVVAPYTDRISYRALGLDLADYHTDTAYTLVTPGGDIGFSELPPWTIPDALVTLPRDFEQHAPEFCDLSHPLDQPLRVRWEPAETYDESDMYLYVSGPPQDEGTPVMMVYPWDDGSWDYSPEALSFFTPGGATFIQSAYRQTRFDVPGSEMANAGLGSSSLLWRGDFVFEGAAE